MSEKIIDYVSGIEINATPEEIASNYLFLPLATSLYHFYSCQEPFTV